VRAEDAPFDAPGFLLLSTGEADPFCLGTAMLFVDPQAIIPVALRADSGGEAKWLLSWPAIDNVPELYLQIVWLDAACTVRPLSASVALGLPQAAGS